MKPIASLSCMFGLAGVVLLAGCGPSGSETEVQSAPAPTTSIPMTPAPATLPSIDTVNAQQFVTGGGALTPLAFDRTGSTTITGSVVGDTAPVYAVPVAAGQTLTVTFQSGSPNLYVNVSDAADHSGAALHRGEMDGATATLKADRDMTFIIAPFQPRATARRNEAGAFSLTVART